MQFTIWAFPPKKYTDSLLRLTGFRKTFKTISQVLPNFGHLTKQAHVTVDVEITASFKCYYYSLQ